MLGPEQRARLGRLLGEIDDPTELANEIARIADAEELFCLASEYNWDDGMWLPKAIANHPLCDSATALLLFWRAGAIEAFYQDEASEFQEEWLAFCRSITARLLRKEFPGGPNSFAPSIGKVQRYKYEKNGIPALLLDPVIAEYSEE